MRPRLAQLHQSGASDGDVPVWDNSAGMWVPGTGSGSGGSSGTPGAPGAPGAAGAPGVSVPPTYQWWTLDADGATERTLDFEPDGAAVVTLNGLQQRYALEYTVDGQALAVLAGMDSRADDILHVTYHPAAPASESTTSTVTVLNDSAHNAFPGAIMADNGDLLIVYRTAASHGSSDGTIAQKRSTDGGATWGSATTAVSVASEDCRDPMLARTPYGLMMTLFLTDSGTNIGHTLRVYGSTDNGTSWTQLASNTGVFSGEHASCGPVVVAPDGSLLWPVYGLDGGTYYRTKIRRSTDGGVTWSTLATISDAGGDFDEPNLAVLSDGRILAMLRRDSPSQGIWSAYSSDSGATWTTPVEQFNGYGRPAVIEHLGTVYVATRSESTDDCIYRTSDDYGATWSAEGTFSPTTNMYVYAQWVRTGGAVPSIAWAEEVTTSNADIFFRRVPL